MRVYYDVDEWYPVLTLYTSDIHDNDININDLENLGDNYNYSYVEMTKEEFEKMQRVEKEFSKMQIIMRGLQLMGERK